MNSTTAIIGKNLVLIGMVSVTVFAFLMRSLSWHDLLIIQLSMGTVYVLLCIIEFSNASYRKSIPAERFSYYPGSFIMFRAIKIGMFLMFGIVLALVPSSIKILYPICFVIAFSEVVILVLKLIKQLCFVSIGADFILIALERSDKIYADQIAKIEYRHDIIYFVKKDGKTREIKLFSAKGSDKILGEVKEWINRNKIEMSHESLERLKGHS